MFSYLRSLQAFSNPSAGISVDVVRTLVGGGAEHPPCCLSQADPLLVLEESLHRARGQPLQHPIQPGEPQQVHGHRQDGLHRWVAGRRARREQSTAKGAWGLEFSGNQLSLSGEALSTGAQNAGEELFAPVWGTSWLVSGDSRALAF